MRLVFLFLVFSCLAALVTTAPIRNPGLSARNPVRRLDPRAHFGFGKRDPGETEAIDFLTVHTRKELMLPLQAVSCHSPIEARGAELYEVVSSKQGHKDYNGKLVYRLGTQSELDKFIKKAEGHVVAEAFPYYVLTNFEARRSG